MGDLLYQATSRESGRNAVVEIYDDRITRTKARSRTSLSRAAQDVETTPMRTISSVQATKVNALHTDVTLYATGNNIVFRMSHGQAERVRHIVTELLLGNKVAPWAPPVAAGWYPDPTGRHEQRWWGGVSWMDAVLDGEEQGSDAEGVAIMDADAAQAEAQAGGAAPAAAAGPSLGEQLRELAELRDQGILTDEEFAAQKAKLLG